MQIHYILQLLLLTGTSCLCFAFLPNDAMQRVGGGGICTGVPTEHEVGIFVLCLMMLCSVWVEVESVRVCPLSMKWVFLWFARNPT